MQRAAKAFTIIEVMLVVMIIGILAAAAIPLMKGRVDNAKWSEANAAAGAIRHSARVYYSKAADGPSIIGNLGDSTIRNKLNFSQEDLTGTYFSASDYQISGFSSMGIPTIVVTGSQTKAPTGTKTLKPDGSWQ